MEFRKKYHPFILPVRNDLIREICKRGVITHRKGKKSRNTNGSSSCFGWGTVDDTLPLIKKDLDFVRRNLDMIMTQVDRKSPLEKPPPQQHKRFEKPASLKAAEPAKKKMRVAPLIEEWYTQCEHFLQSGAVGLVPDCYSENLPPLDQVMETSVGQVLAHYSRFLRGRL